MIGDKHGILECWRDYFAGLLQRDTQGTDDGVGNVVGEPQEEDDISWYEGVAQAMEKLKNRMAPGVCGIDAEMLKGGETVVEWLHSVIQWM